MSPVRLTAVALACLLSAGPLRTPLAANEQPKQPPSAEMARLKQELARLAEEMKKLRAELAQGPSPTAPAEERLRDLEATLARLEDDLKRLAEEARPVAGAVDEMASREQKRSSLTAYGSLDFSAYRGENSILDGRSFGLVFSGRPHERLSFLAEIAFGRAASAGGPRSGEVEVEQAFSSFSLSSSLNLRAGIVLVPFGNVNIDHFAPKREVVTAPLVSSVVAPSVWTDNGLGLFGKQVLGSTWLLTYEGYLVAGLGAPVTGLGLRQARQGYGVDNNDDKALVARLALSRANTAHLGLSGYSGKYDDRNRKRLNGWAVDGLLTLGPFRITGDINAFTAAQEAGPDIRLRGFYVRGVYGFGRARLAGTRLGGGFDEPLLSLFAQYDDVQADGPVDGSFDHSQERRATAGLNFRPSTQWVLKLSYERNSSEGHTLDRGDRDGFLGSIGFIF